MRRDGCPLLVKMLEKVLRLLFTTRDLSQVKGYLYRQWTRILTDWAAVGDFIFAKEVPFSTHLRVGVHRVFLLWKILEGSRVPSCRFHRHALFSVFFSPRRYTAC